MRFPPRRRTSRRPPAQKPAYTPQGRQMGRYKAFARQAQMPAIKVLDQTTLAVGDTPSADLHRLARLSAQRERGAGRPVRSAGERSSAKVLDSATNSPPPDAAQLAQDLRTAVIDYRFLQRRVGAISLRRRKASRPRPMRCRPCKAATSPKPGSCMTGCKGRRRLPIFESSPSRRRPAAAEHFLSPSGFPA